MQPMEIGKVKSAVASIRTSLSSRADAEIGIILGSGFKGLGEEIEDLFALPYGSILNFPQSTVESHEGALLFGTIEGKRVVVMSGRHHIYEGLSPDQIALPIRVMKLLGVDLLMVTNAAGALNTAKFSKGDLMFLEDHANYQFFSSLIGTNEKAFAPTRFVDMSEPYDKFLRVQAVEACSKEDVMYKEGVYVAVPGPQLETRAEYRALKLLGFDAVGMSTVQEVIAARHIGMKVIGCSVLTDECDPDNLVPTSMEEIVAVASEAEPKLTRVFKQIIKSYTQE